jgi:hypothetical protein
MARTLRYCRFMFSKVRPWVLAASVTLLAASIWFVFGHDGSARARQAAISRGLAYLDRYPIDQLGLEYTKSGYAFALSYPEGADLGNYFVAASVLEAYAAAGVSKKALEIGEYLRTRQDSSGLFPFDRHKFSVDADTTLNVLGALHEIGLLWAETAARALEALDEHHQVACRYRTYRPRGAEHPNGGTHPEVTYNALYIRSLFPNSIGPDLGCIAEAIMAEQTPAGLFTSYWYPERLHVHYDALRALRAYASKAGDARVIEASLGRGVDYLLKAQGSDGGWGKPGSSFDTAFALLALKGAFAGADKDGARLAVERGTDYLVRTQREDGSWRGERIFYWYYPQCPGKTCPEEWHDRGRRIMTTAAVVEALASTW